MDLWIGTDCARSSHSSRGADIAALVGVEGDRVAGDRVGGGVCGVADRSDTRSSVIALGLCR